MSAFGNDIEKFSFLEFTWQVTVHIMWANKFLSDNIHPAVQMFSTELWNRLSLHLGPDEILCMVCYTLSTDMVKNNEMKTEITFQSNEWLMSWTVYPHSCFFLSRQVLRWLAHSSDSALRHCSASRSHSCQTSHTLPHATEPAQFAPNGNFLVYL